RPDRGEDRRDQRGGVEGRPEQPADSGPVPRGQVRQARRAEHRGRLVQVAGRSGRRPPSRGEETTDHEGEGMKRYAAIAFAVAALAAPAAAFAQDNGPTDPGVRCAAKVGPGQYESYLPGERATDVNGNKWVCGPDGQWFRDYSALRVNVHRVVAVAAY